MGIVSRLFGNRPITAAATQVSGPRAMETQSRRVRDVSEAWRIWREVGEIHYVTTQQARQVSRLDWDIYLDRQLLEPDDRDELIRVSFGRDLPELARLCALHFQVAGGYYLARFSADNSWKVVPHPASHRDIRGMDGADVIVLVTNPDPADSALTDSPVLAALGVARELLLARGQARASARSRTAQLQTVLYPSEAIKDVDKFERDLMAVMTAPMADEHSTASVVPNLIAFNGDKIDKWRTLDLTGPVDEHLHEKIQSLIRQLAVILDAPPEILTGMGDVNHWGQWGIQEDNWLGHVEPMSKEIGRGFAVALARAAGVDVQVIDVLPDPGPLLRRRPSLDDVLEAYELDLVSADWAREQLGADEDDAPDAAEKAEKYRRNRSGAGDGARPGPAVAEPSEPQVAAAVPADQVEVEPVEDQVDLDSGRLLAVDFQLLDAVEDLLEVALEQATRRVGAQIRSRAQGNPELKERIGDLPNEEIPLRVGTEGLSGLEETVRSSVDQFLTRRFSRLVERAYSDTRTLGVEIHSDPVELQVATDLLVDGAVELALAHLRGAPTRASIWTLSRRTVTVAGGGDDPASIDPTVAALPLVGLASGVVRAGVSAVVKIGSGIGVALGQKALRYIRGRFGREAKQYIWRHRYRGDDPHPQHQTFEGMVFDGKILDVGDGIDWYPGDHLGCMCGAEPDWS